MTQPVHRYQRVVLLGLDGLDPTILQLLLDQGRLPGFAKLLRRGGAIHPWTSTTPPQSPVVWSTLATGVNPGGHGVFDFIERAPGTYLPHLSILRETGGIHLTGERFQRVWAVPAFWELPVFPQGDGATVLRWPVTFPPPERGNHLLAGMGVPDVHGMLGKYTYVTTSEEPSKETEQLVRATREGDVVTASIPGPKIDLGFKLSTRELPLTVDLDVAGSAATLHLAGNNVRVAVGAWSGWIRASIKLDLLRSVKVVFKAYLAAVTPHLQLYIGPLEHDPLDPAVRLSTPPEYSAALAKELGLYHTLGMPEDTKAFENDRLPAKAFLAQAEEIIAERERMLWKTLDERPSGVAAVVFDLPDRIQHVFWRENRLDDEGIVVGVGETIAHCYQRLDQILDELLDRLGPDTALVVLSDHGFTSFSIGVDLNTWLVGEGYQTLVARPTPGKQGELFSLVDWSKTRVFALGFTGVYLNLRGREPKGIVTAAEAQPLLAEVERRLLGLEDIEHSRKPLYRVHRAAAIYKGNRLERAPDLVLGFHRGYRMSWQTAIGGVHGEVFSPNLKKWCGDHLVDPAFVPGILASTVPLSAEGASVLDLAPTVLGLLGLPPQASHEGRDLSRPEP
ncbi:MAG: hypothetical protein A2284_14030 [Deltaproteobacteria bacterium RIFOXYA12_FULL_61_11]|nr:MAG: hypothetical protein A2284_14030 [Deltaproteobacteria bacterium RIFOXYA12_FULL_61_11]